MKKLELTLKELAPYLPYGLKVFSNKIETLTGIECAKVKVREFDMFFPIENCKPILRPLSDLTKEIEYKGAKLVPQSKLSHLDLEWLITSENLIMKTNYEDVLQLFEWHFDIFGLIEADLAIDINTIRK